MRFCLAIILTLVAAPSFAQDCRHAGLIVAMAEHRLASPDGRALRSRDMARAAYLKIYYDDLSGEKIEGLLSDLASATDQSQAATELKAIYDLSYDSGLARWRIATPAILDEFASASPDLLRALILADEGETFLRLRAEVLSDDTSTIEPFFAGPRPALYLSDQSDAFRVAFSEKAEAESAIMLAGAVIAGHSDPRLFQNFVERHEVFFDGLNGDTRWRFAPYSNRLRSDLIAEQSSETGEYGSFLAEEFSVQEASLTTFPISFLGLYHSQSGRQDTTYDAARAVLTAKDLGVVDPLRNPGYFWHLAYEVLSLDRDAFDVRGVLAGIDIDTGRNWHEFTDALWQLDTLVATSTMLPYLNGSVDAAPVAPDPTVIDWELWTEVANHLRQNALKAAFDTHPTATIELLWAQEKYALAWGLSLGNEEQVNVARLSVDLATRLDMLCGQHTILSDLTGRWGRERLFHFE